MALRCSTYLLLAILTLMDSFAYDRSQARSMTVTSRGIVATSVTLASQAGAQILARGGNAVDAAIAANATLGVVEPMMNGIGGDLFAIVRLAGDSQPQGLNASGWAPAGLSIDHLKKAGITAMPAYGIHTVTVPGCVAGWAALHAKYGRLPWKDLFQPAIYYAESGFPVPEVVHEEWGAAAEKLRSDEYARGLFLPHGNVPALGQIFHNPDLARSLRMIAESGPAAFYRGAISEALLARSAALDGTMSSADLADFQAEWIEPISTTYRGWTVYEIPPNSQGIAALEMLNMMERFDLGKLGFTSPESFHFKIEAQKLAYMDLARYVADPRFAKVPVPGMLDKRYAASRAIDPAKANCRPAAGNPPLPGKGDTTYLSTVDSEGNMVSLIQSIFQSFGSGITVPGYGFHLHNRGALFVLNPKHPNALAPRKRPFHTIIPGYMEKGSQRIAFGIMGGLNQGQAHAQFVSNIADHGMNIQAALEAPRFSKLNFGGCDLKIEPRLPPVAYDHLRSLGHQLTLTGDFSHLEMGCGQAVLFDTGTGVKFGASDPRKDGAAVPEPDPFFQQP
jgi:gamma-glutamyltranspeptidase / glutathione hydrolase